MMDLVREMIGRALRPVMQRVGGMVLRGVVTLVNNATTMQGLQITLMSDETDNDVERFEEYGLTSVPFTGAEAIALAVGGNPDHRIVIKVADRRHRLAGLVEGEVALYDDQGQKVHIKRNSIDIEATSGKDIYINVSGAGKVYLDGGGAGVARLGDIVTVNSLVLVGATGIAAGHSHPLSGAGAGGSGAGAITTASLTVESA